MKKFLKKLFSYPLLLLFLTWFVLLNQVRKTAHSAVNFGGNSPPLLEIESIRQILDETLTKNTPWPDSIPSPVGALKANYSFDGGLTAEVERLLKKYRPDYSVAVVIDNETGKILSAVDYQKNKNLIGRNLAFTSTHPSASLFKIISSAQLLHNGDVTNNSSFAYQGRATTLYKYQLVEKITRWTKSMTFEKAFATSNNVIFGKAALKYSHALEIFNMARSFGFFQGLMQEISVGSSLVPMPETQYQLAEVASGFSTDTLISPLHGALMVSIAANDGILKTPYLLETLENPQGQVVWRPRRIAKTVIAPEVAEKLRKMMQMTITEGTARKTFRRFPRKLKENLEMGGKTGSLTGGVPFGKRDWFVVYAKEKGGSKGISICVMNVNVEKWYVRSSQIAKDIIEYYYNQNPPRGLSASL